MLLMFYVEANCLSSQKGYGIELKTESQSSLKPKASVPFFFLAFVDKYLLYCDFLYVYFPYAAIYIMHLKTFILKMS